MDSYLDSARGENDDVAIDEEGTRYAEDGAAMNWVTITVTRPADGASRKHKLFFIFAGAHYTRMVFSASLDTFARYESAFDAIAHSFHGVPH